MSLLPGVEIGVEIHDKEDQFIRVEQGHAEAMVNPSRTMTSLAAEHFSFDY